MHRQKDKSISSRKGNGDTDREREKERDRESERERGRKRCQYTDRWAHGHISVLGHRHDMPAGKF